MTTLAALQTQVEAQYAHLDLPRWPAPRDHMDSPSDTEYSRVTEPERYRIVHARARTWSEVLSRVPGVSAEPLSPAPPDENRPGGLRPNGFDRGLRLLCTRAGTLPLLLMERDVPLQKQPGSLPILYISVAEPQFCLATLPDCGCDACDTGSDDLIDAIDEAIGHAVGGPFVILQSDTWGAQWFPDGGASWGADTGPGHDALMDLCRHLADGETVRLPENTASYVGRSWLT